MPARNPFEATPIKSRRGGPVKQPLSRAAIVNEALRQLSSDGGMSLRKVATALETGPASLYAYIDDLNELHALVLDQALASVELVGAAKLGWRERLQQVLESYAQVLAASPGLAQLAFGSVAVGPNALRITDTLLGLLDEGGVELATAAWAVDLFILYVTAIVAEHADGLNPADPQGAVARAVAGASEHDYPRVYAARSLLLSGSAEERFSWAIDVMVQGILATSPSSYLARAATASSPSRTPKKPRRPR